MHTTTTICRDGSLVTQITYLIDGDRVVSRTESIVEKAGIENAAVDAPALAAVEESAADDAKDTLKRIQEIRAGALSETDIVWGDLR